MFIKQIRLFNLFGFEVKLDLSWLLLGLLITWSLAEGLFPSIVEGLSRGAYWTLGLLGTLGLLFSIVFHEFSHSLVARRYGMPIKGITLFLFGGVAEMDEEPTSPKAEFLMAVAGPISSIILGVICYLLLGVVNNFELSWLSGLLFYLAYLNIVLAVFNLVPAFPLDGGRMLRAALWGWKHDLRRATRLASQFGSGFGIILIVLGVLSVLQGNFIGGMWWFLIGLFLRGAAQMSYRQVIMRETMKGETVRRFMNTSPVTVASDLSLQDLVEDYVYQYHYKMFPVVDQGRLQGFVSTSQIKEVARDQWSSRTVADIVQPSGPDNTVSADEDAFDALGRMQRSGLSRLMVVDGGDHLLGIIAMKDLMDWLSLKLDLEPPRAA